VPYFDILKNCGNTSDNSCWLGASKLKYLNGVISSYDAVKDAPYSYRFITSDGIIWHFQQQTFAPPNRLATLDVDINGIKEPNTVGRDIFAFSLYVNKGFMPCGAYQNSNENIIFTSTQRDAASGEGCNPAGGCGWMCTAKVLSENAMNY
jgi:hypothetical protein